MKKKIKTRKNKFGARGGETSLLILDCVFDSDDSDDEDYGAGEVGLEGLVETQSQSTAGSLIPESFDIAYCNASQDSSMIPEVEIEERFDPRTIAHFFARNFDEMEEGTQEILLESIRRILNEGQSSRRYVVTPQSIEMGETYGTPDFYINFYKKFIQEGLQTNFTHHFMSGADYKKILADAKTINNNSDVGRMNSELNLINRVALYGQVVRIKKQSGGYNDQLRSLEDSVKSYRRLGHGLSKLLTYCNYPIGIIDSSLRENGKILQVEVSNSLTTMFGELVISITNLNNKKTKEFGGDHPLIDLTRIIFKILTHLLNESNTTFLIVFLFNAELRIILQLIAEVIAKDCLHPRGYDLQIENIYKNIKDFLVKTTIDREGNLLISQDLDEVWELFTGHWNLSPPFRFEVGASKIWRTEYKKEASIEVSQQMTPKLWFIDFLTKSAPLYVGSTTTCALGYVVYSTASCGYFLFNKFKNPIAKALVNTARSTAMAVVGAARSNASVLREAAVETATRASERLFEDGRDFVATSINVFDAIVSVAKNIPVITKSGIDFSTNNPKIAFMIFSIIWVSGETYVNSMKNTGMRAIQVVEDSDARVEDTEPVDSSVLNLAPTAESPSSDPDDDAHKLLKMKIKDYVNYILGGFRREKQFPDARGRSVYDFLKKEFYINIIKTKHNTILNVDLETNSLDVLNSFEQLDEILQDLFMYSLLQANPHLILNSHDILENLTLSNVIEKKEEDDSYVIEVDDNSVITDKINDYYSRGDLRDQAKGILNIVAQYSQKDKKLEHYWIKIKELFEVGHETVNQTNSVKALKKLFEVTKNWLMKETETEERSGPSGAFGNIMKPYRKNIVSYNGDGYPVLETAFGNLKVKDDKQGLYVRGGGRKWYLYRWGSKVKKIKNW
tara:strand:+ start:2220 stop:4928 length:2709 start_codon:yes stop_codon:yes gene_type:complete